MDYTYPHDNEDGVESIYIEPPQGSIYEVKPSDIKSIHTA